MKNFAPLLLVGMTTLVSGYPANAAKPLFFIECQMVGQTTKMTVNKDKMCAAIKDKIRANLPKSSMYKGDWVKVMLTMPAANKLDALVSRKRAGKTKTYPVVGIRIYDRALSDKDAVQLGDAIVANMQKR
jgi:hypothetical protein